MIIAVLIFILVSFIYLILVGGNQKKSDNEQEMEDQEQMKYLKDYEIKKQLKKAEKIKNKFCDKNGKMKK